VTETAATTILFFFLGLGGGWFFVLPVVEWAAGPRVAILAAIATGLAFAVMAATGTLPQIPPIDESTCHDRQGSHRC
jgi:membrane associated rhomboid family serine protease